MSARGNHAINQLLALLESRYAIRVLWALRDGLPQTFRLLQDSVGRITPNTLNTRLKDLRAAQLITHADNGYSLTASGMDLTRRISDLNAFATRWAAAQAAGTAGAAAAPHANTTAKASKAQTSRAPARRTRPKAALQITDTRTGRGAAARTGQRVSVHYTGWLYAGGKKGEQFASSHDLGAPYVFTLGAGEVIRGWEEGVPGMKVGGHRTLIIPPEMGYGSRGATGIPPGATPLFDIELLSTKR